MYINIDVFIYLSEAKYDPSRIMNHIGGVIVSAHVSSAIYRG